MDLLHEGCARDWLTAMASPPVELPAQTSLDEHGARRVASVPFMLTQDMKRRLRASGYARRGDR